MARTVKQSFVELVKGLGDDYEPALNPAWVAAVVRCHIETARKMINRFLDRDFPELESVA